MQIIKFNLDNLLSQNTGFSYYLLGRSYDLEENGVLQDYSKALYYYQKGFENGYPLCTYFLSIDKGKAKK